jgi:6-phosphogluconolactonase/glucosamine-6-phosphate isomerase/deaminase
MTLAGISRSDEIALLFFGEEKLEVYEQAKASADAYPLSRLLRQKRAPVRLFWAP